MIMERLITLKARPDRVPVEPGVGTEFGERFFRYGRILDLRRHAIDVAVILELGHVLHNEPRPVVR